jgi:predicted nucleotidyltransferase
MKHLLPLIKELARSFTRHELRFAFGGALANNYWGIVRTTQDVDCLVAIPALKYQLLANELETLGCYMIDESGDRHRITVARMRDQVIQRKLIECFCDSVRVELFVPVIPLQDELLRRAVMMPLDDQRIPITTAEDMILLKLAFHRTKDIQDVKGILWVQRGRLDLDYLRKWANKVLETESQTELQSLIEQYGSEAV